MNNSKSKKMDIVKELAQKTADSLGLKLWDVKFVKEGSTWYLRIFIDNENGVSIQDCENMSKALDSPLDVLDPIQTSYCLEVCSPGIERELSTDSHLEQFLNYDVNVTLIRPDLLGNKKIKASLTGFDKNTISIKKENSEVEKIDRKNIAHIKLSADF